MSVLRRILDRAAGIVVGGVGIVVCAVMWLVVAVGFTGAALSVLFFPVGVLVLIILACLKMLGAL